MSGAQNVKGKNCGSGDLESQQYLVIGFFFLFIQNIYLCFYNLMHVLL